MSKLTTTLWCITDVEWKWIRYSECIFPLLNNLFCYTATKVWKKRCDLGQILECPTWLPSFILLQPIYRGIHCDSYHVLWKEWHNNIMWFEVWHDFIIYWDIISQEMNVISAVTMSDTMKGHVGCHHWYISFYLIFSSLHVHLDLDSVLCCNVLWHIALHPLIKYSSVDLKSIKN